MVSTHRSMWFHAPPLAVAALLFVALLTSGCSSWPLSSKWAMDDPDYAEKYSKPYGDDKPVRMLKQMVDARHVDNQYGAFVGAGGAGDPASVGAEIGTFVYPTEWLEVDLSLATLLGTGDDSIFFGPAAGVRVQAPARISPFVGVGTFVGGNTFDKPADNDGLDNDDDQVVDESGERKDGFEGFASVYPEIGAHLWMTGRCRLTANARYYVTSAGRADDFWYCGLSIGWLIGSHGDGEEFQLQED